MTVILSPLSNEKPRRATARLKRPARRRGRPMWQPTHSQTVAVKEAARRGLPQHLISALMGVSESTLKRRFSEELAVGSLIANAAIALTAYELAISGRDPSMTRWWLRVRMGWRDRCADCTRKGERGAMPLTFRAV
jgi:AraC-like DNA-binding protein